ncbi:MAG TPA: phosphatase PAP2 family protein [Candidatus Dormibacteraeota bacterium]|nr:phosphatase PAP2 family protein [Candidatus Dormibacteraeota bacterium]
MNSVIVFCAQYLYLIIIIGLGISWIKTTKNQKTKFILVTIVAGIIAFIVSRIASRLYYDPRPFVAQHVKPLITHAADNGFPSDHALLTMALTAVTYFFNKKIAAGMLILTVIVGIARILAKVHSPLDISTGWLIGVVGAVTGYYIVSYFWSKKSK